MDFFKEIQLDEELKQLREKLVVMLTEISKRGIRNPERMADADVEQVDHLLDEWTDKYQDYATAIGTFEVNLEFSLSRLTVYTDAGFDDPEYLDEIANDWLMQDLDNAEALGLVDLANKIRAKIAEIQAKIE
jgi:hypothetical protein